MDEFEQYGSASSSSDDDEPQMAASSSSGATGGRERKAPRKTGGAFPARKGPGGGPSKPRGKSVAFDGTVTVDGTKMYVLPYEKATTARLVVSLPMKCNSLTLQSVLGGIGAPNYGDADVACGVVAAYNQIVSLLSQGRFYTKYQYSASVICSVDSAVNMVFDFAAREGKVFNSLKTILGKLVVPRQEWSMLLKNLVDEAGKPLKPSAEGFAAACYALSEARNRVNLFICGRTLIRSTEGQSGAKAKAAGKLEKAMEALDRLEKAPSARQSAHGARPAPKCQYHAAIKNGLDFFGYNFYSKGANAWPCGHGYCCRREMHANADQKRVYAEGIMRHGDLAGPLSAFLAAGTGLFTADDLSVFMSRLSSGDITKAI